MPGVSNDPKNQKRFSPILEKEEPQNGGTQEPGDVSHAQGSGKA